MDITRVVDAIHRDPIIDNTLARLVSNALSSFITRVAIAIATRS